MPRQIFRQEALNRLSSPEQLDQLMRVTSSRSWIALAAVGLLLFVALLWGIFGTIPTTVPAQGFLVRRGVQSLDAPHAGVVKEIKVGSGDEVAKGQELVVMTGGPGQTETTIVSPFRALVLGRRARREAAVEKDAPLLMLEPLDETLSVRLFVPVSDGYGIKRDMAVQVWPSHVRQGDSGHLVGKIRFASKYPVSQDEIERLVTDSELARRIGQAGPCLQVMVELEADPGSRSGYRWSSSQGTALPLFSGTPCEARITVHEQRPIQLVFPAFGRSRVP